MNMQRITSRILNVRYACGILNTVDTDQLFGSLNDGFRVEQMTAADGRIWFYLTRVEPIQPDPAAQALNDGAAFCGQ